MRQVRAERGAVDDVEAARRELAKPDGFLETNPGFAFEVLDNTAQFQGEINLLQHAQQEIELMGPNAALLGKDDGAPSGRAIAMNQNSGQTEIGVLVDRLLWLKKRTYQRVWDLCRQYKQAEWWVRVTDNEDNVKFVGFNRPVTMAEKLQKRMAEAGAAPELIQAKMAEAQSDPMLSQQLQMQVDTENVPARMYMDITIEQIPSVANVQQEQFDSLVKLAPSVVFPPEVYIQASSLRNKRELLEKMKGPPPDPVAAEAQKIQLEQTIKKTEAEIGKLKAEAAKIATEADMMSAPLGQITMPQISKAPGGSISGSSGPMEPMDPNPVAPRGMPQELSDSVPAAGAPGATELPPPGI
jgi:chemotaxis receptor (MCP) glutamine deamidase CheD